MTPDLDRKLVAKYPKMFKDRHGSTMETGMCWGFQCDDGWFDIIDALCSLLQYYTDHLTRPVTGMQHRVSRIVLCTIRIVNKLPGSLSHGLWKIYEKLNKGPAHPQVVVSCVKEKFGTLRFYVNDASAEQYALITMAENLSSRTCEVCGSMKAVKLRNSGCLKTMCNDCVERLTSEGREVQDVGNWPFS